MDSTKSGDESLLFQGKQTDFTISDFWRWGFSDLLDNVLRGTYCEFVVGAALGVDLSTGRTNWSPWDITFPYAWEDAAGRHDIIRVEVKNSSYLQSWNEGKLSKISFGIAPKEITDPAYGTMGEKKRQSDVYVLCHYKAQDRATADPLVLDDWDFYVVSTKVLDKVCAGQKSIGLTSLQGLCHIKTDFSGIKDSVIRCATGLDCWQNP